MCRNLIVNACFTRITADGSSRYKELTCFCLNRDTMMLP